MGHPLTLVDFLEMYRTEDACRDAIFAHRWREGFRCPRCNHARAWCLRGRGPYECARCGHQASVTAGTAFHKARTDLRQWLPANLAAGVDEEAALGSPAVATAGA